MTKTNFRYLSADKKTRIYAACWEPEKEPVAVLQVAHGITEHIERYQSMAEYFVPKGFVVAGNDHLGHGHSMNPDDPHPAYFGPKGSWKFVEEDVKTCTNMLRQRYPGVPHCLLGFSLGSFVVRCLLGDEPGVADMAILAGTGQMKNYELSIAQVIVKREEKKHGDLKDTALIHKLTMETYNRHYAPCRTASDWLLANQEAVDEYMADPLCGDGFTVSSFRELLYAMKVCSAPEHLGRMKKTTPILFLSGKEDAVGDFGKGVEKAAELFRKAQMSDVSVQLFEGMRHDIFREKECGKVFEYIYDWTKEKCRDWPKSADSKQQTPPQAAPSRSEDNVPGVKEGYLVDRFYSYGEPVDFVNEKKGIRKPIIRNHEFVGFPGVDEATEEGRRYNKHSNRSYSDWMDFVERKPIGARFYYRVEFSRPDEQGQTRVLWMLQPHDTADENGFGMENIPEIMLAAYLDENGDYTGPFRLERVAW
ncbi:MAG: alpha/beta hydrolase [Lachnospiraceae bacterium]|nr:alpha/beta hydrolase [Lachnospiraceae bacterium]